MTFEIFVVLFLGGFSAGFVDSVAGGGGLISLPVLLAVGLPPQLALGTNKLQGSFGTLSSSYNYIRNGKVDLKASFVGIIYTFLGAAIGAVFIQRLDPGVIQHLIPVLLLMVFFYTLFSKGLGYQQRVAVMPAHLFFFMFGMGLGFYDGFFGPGTGSFWTAALLALLGYDLTRAAGATRVFNLTSNVVALALFVIGSNVLYSAGICMALGQVLGARLGSGMAIKRGARFIRPIFLTVVFLTIIRLVYLYYF